MKHESMKIIKNFCGIDLKWILNWKNGYFKECSQTNPKKGLGGFVARQ